MKDTEKAKGQLMNELVELRQQIAKLQALKAEHKRAQEAFHESEEKYRILVEQANDGILIVQDGIIKFANQRLAEANGRTVEELLNTNFLDYVHPDEIPKVANRYQRRMAGEDVEQVYETVLLHKDGHEIPVEINAGAITYQGRPGVFAFVRDHTDRKRAEETLRKSEEKLRAIIEASPLPLVIIQPDGTVTLWNPAAENLFGWSEDEVLGKYIPVVPEEKQEEHRNLRRRTFHHGKSFTGLEVVRQKKDGTLIDVALSTAPIYDAEGNVESVMGVVEDISERKRTEEKLRKAQNELERRVEERTAELLRANEQLKREIAERKQVEEALRESEEKYHNLYKLVRLTIDNVPDLIWAKDMNDRFTLVNQAMCNKLLMCGSPDKAIGKTDMFFAEQERNAGFEHTFGEICVNSDVITKERKAPGRFLEDGLVRNKYLVLDVHKAPFLNEDCEMVGTVGCGRDVTKEKETEEALQKSEEFNRTLLENMADRVFAKDTEGRYILLNKASHDFWGIPHGTAIGKTDWEIHHEYTAKIFTASDRMVFETGKPYLVEENARTKDGRELVLSVTKAPLRDKAGNITGLVGISRDITDIKKAERTLRKARDELERRVEERTADLVKLNEKLKQEIEERKQAEQNLKKRETELEIQAAELEEVNSALRVLLKRRDEDKTEFEEKTLSNVKELVLPYLERLKRSGLDAKQTAYANILESNLNDIVSPFIHKLSSKYIGLTPTEIQIANLVKEGKTTKEIAEILNSSHRTVEFHRKNIRKKIGIVNRKANLRSRLLSM
jgi:PAS domain S-box-containing protein